MTTAPLLYVCVRPLQGAAAAEYESFRAAAHLEPSQLAQHDLVRDGWTAAQDVRPDVIVFHPKMLAGAPYAEALGVPAVLAAVFPQLVPTATMPGVGFPDWPLGPLYHRLTNRIVLTAAGALGRRYYGPWRAAHGLPRRSPGLLDAPDGTESVYRLWVEAGSLIWQKADGDAAHLSPASPEAWSEILRNASR